MKDSEYPEPVAGGFIRNQEGKFLLVKSYKWKDVWSVPGGHVELGERIVDTLRREIFEEVGLKVEPTRVLAVREAIFPKGFIKKKHFIFFDYLCETKSSKVKLDKKELSDYIWVDKKRLMKLKVEPYAKDTFKLLSMEGTYEPSIPTKLEKYLLTG